MSVVQGDIIGVVVEEVVNLSRGKGGAENKDGGRRNGRKRGWDEEEMGGTGDGREKRWEKLSLIRC